MKGPVLAALAFWCAIGSAQAQSSAGGPVTVTADNFNRAETDMYFAQFVKRGELGKFVHLRDLPLEGTGVRPNRDTLYSEAVFDLDAGPVKITLPKAGKRFMSMMAINEDHYVTSRSPTAQAITPTAGPRSGRVISSWRSALSSIPPTRRMSNRPTPCRTPSQ